MSLRPATSRILALALGVIVAVIVAACSLGSDQGDPGAGNPESKATDYEQALADAPPALAALYADGDQIIDGGLAEFDAQLEKLNGHPVVVNAWASWCGPCRLEFPDFQAVSAERGDEVAFLGVNVDDSTDAANELPRASCRCPTRASPTPTARSRTSSGCAGCPVPRSTTPAASSSISSKGPTPPRRT